MAEVPETRYAETPHGRVAYQLSGAGPVGLIGVKQGWFPVDLMWDDRHFAGFLSRLSVFTRHVWFDQRGSGSSDGLPLVAGRFIEDGVDDMVGVLDVLGWERAAVLGGLGPAELVFAATHPGRTKALVLINPFARLRRAEGYPEGLPEAVAEERLTAVRTRWGTGAVIDAYAPSAAHDVDFRRWYSRCERLGCAPDDAHRRFRALFDADVRDVLSTVTAPTLVVLRRGCATAAASRYVAENIRGARLVELPGDDRLFFAGDTTALLDPVEEFLTGRLPTPDVDRVLATVVFTDLVGSTDAAVRLGDRQWRDLLAAHHRVIRHELDRHRGREVKTTGDGFLATFDGPGRAVRFGCAILDAVSDLGFAVRIGIHTGEIVLQGDDVAGIAVHIAQRVQAHADAGGVLVSRTVVDLVAGSDLHFTDRGEYELRGVPKPWRLFSVDRTSLSA
jgi:class 3 adenylate cyclase